jgi:hypothetical protein
MKLIVCIVASCSQVYDAFKIIQINYIIKLKKFYPHLDINFYFLYSVIDVKDAIYHLDENRKFIYCDFYDKDIEKRKEGYISKSMFKRSIAFFNHLKNENLLNNDTFILRTNLTTLFDFQKVMQWLNNKPNQLFISGSFIGEYQAKNTTFSGTNIIMSSDVILYLSNIPYNIEYLDRFSEDQLISRIVIQKLPVFIINIKRLDIIEIDAIYIKPTICYHKCNIGDESIFSFRFKTHNRQIDIECISKLSNDIFNNDFSIGKYIVEIVDKYNFDLTTESQKYGQLYSESTFKLIH